MLRLIQIAENTKFVSINFKEAHPEIEWYTTIEKLFHKSVDLLAHEQLVNNAAMIKDILAEAIKIYG